MNEYRDKLIKLYLKAESDIINEIARLRSLGFADYHVVAALNRVRQILNSMKTEAWEWSPKAIEYEDGGTVLLEDGGTVLLSPSAGQFVRTEEPSPCLQDRRTVPLSSPVF